MPDAHAQFLRIGSFDFTATTRLEGIYTTNVEQERESESTEEREDYYYIVGLDLTSRSAVSPSTKLTISTGVSVEKHFNRPDLDNSSNPFGNVELDALTEVPPWYLRSGAYWRRESTSADNAYRPGGGKKRDPSTSWGYSVRPGYRRDNISMEAGYTYDQERHDEDQYKSGDKDETHYLFNAREALTRRIALSQSYDREETEMVSSDTPKTIKTTYLVLAEYRVTIKPSFVVGAGFEKEENSSQEGGDDWEPIIRLSLSDDRKLTPRLTLRYQATYTSEKDQEEDDISFQYGATLEHRISYSAVQSVSATREPRKTFGSTTDTDTTTFAYTFNKMDLFIRGLNFRAAASYEINKPVDGPEEDITSYTVGLSHSARYSRRLSRTAAYDYSIEDSNLYPGDPIEEHRFTITFRYLL